MQIHPNHMGEQASEYTQKVIKVSCQGYYTTGTIFVSTFFGLSYWHFKTTHKLQKLSEYSAGLVIKKLLVVVEDHRSGRIIFFSRVKFLCSYFDLSTQHSLYLFHPHVKIPVIPSKCRDPSVPTLFWYQHLALLSVPPTQHYHSSM